VRKHLGREPSQTHVTLADKLKSWTRLVKSAYEHLPKRQRSPVRFIMMSVLNGCGDYDAVLHLLPKHFTGEFALVELAYAIDATFELGNTELMDKLAKRSPDAVRKAEHPIMKSRLLLCLAECLVRAGKWDGAISVLERVQTNETFCRNAVTGIVEIHASRALLALRQGFQFIERFNRNFDPETEIMLPGNDRAVQEQAAKEFRRLQKILESIVPRKRWKGLLIEIGGC